MADAAPAPAAATDEPQGPAAKRRRGGRPGPKEGVLPTMGDASALHITCRPESYAQELEAKVAAVKASFSAAGVVLPDTVDVYPSASSNFRLKATFGVEPRSWRGNRSYLASASTAAAPPPRDPPPAC